MTSMTSYFPYNMSILSFVYDSLLYRHMQTAKQTVNRESEATCFVNAGN